MRRPKVKWHVLHQNILDIIIIMVTEGMLLVGGLEHEFYDFPFSWEWKIIPTDSYSSEGLVVQPEDSASP